MPDTLTATDRSTLMAKVRSKNNRSTELRVQAALISNKIKGWKKHPDTITGKPDFYFPRRKLVLFVDGCFWHACPRCGRLPKSNVAFWRKKIDSNRKRDAKTRKLLRARGYHVFRLWEHELRTSYWIKRLLRQLK
jgi:DNA mismatch endonuclease (patch repair protein)